MFSPPKTMIFLPLAHSANEMFLRGVDPHLHQAAAEAAGVRPEGPFKTKDLAALTVEALQCAGPGRTTTLETHT